MLITRFGVEVLVSVVTAIAGVVVAIGAMEFGTGWGDAGPEPGYFPFYLGFLLFLASLGTGVQAVIFHRGRNEVFISPEQARHLAGFFGPMVVFVLTSIFLGLYVSTALYLFLVTWLKGRYSPWLSLGVGLGVAAFFYLAFEIWFRVPLLKGPLEQWLGL